MSKSFQDKKIAVLGRGIEGESSASYLKKHGALVTILDEKEDKDAFNDLDSYDMIVRSPGVLLRHEKLKGIPKEKITSQTKLFFDLCPCEIIGVTGTKGKGTTSSLIYEMLKRQGYDAYLGGNIGQPPFVFLDTLTPQPASRQGGSKVVLELSSFQLEDFVKSPTSTRGGEPTRGGPHIAVLLMITQEHLTAWENANYHTDINEYVNAKRNILRFQTEKDFAILNADYPATRESDVETLGKVLHVSREGEVGEGVFVKDGQIFIRRGGIEEKLMDASDVKLPGKHNLENACAAIMAALLSGVSKANIISVLKTFEGLEHRIEFVATVNGVRYYDDSFSTTPETAIAAIESFEDPEILILGGSSKGSDFKELGQVISEASNIKAIIGVGLEWEKIKKSIKYQVSGIKYIEGCRNMKEIAQAAFDAAKPGDVVLLSPACASFDMFKNYKDRGEQFKKEVQLLRN